jgi:hypothetical protein
MIRKLCGLLCVLAAVAGLLFSIFCLVQIWRYRPAVTQSVVDNLTLLDQALTTTQSGLTTVSQMVQTTTVDVASLQTTTLALSQAIHDTNPMLDSLTTLTSKDLPAAISATQTSLASAQSSALLIDNVLEALTSIPLLTIAAYKPDVPLHTALAQVSTSLDSLPAALATISTSLAGGQTKLVVVEVEMGKVSDTTSGISTALGSAQVVINQYQTVVMQLKTQVETLQGVALDWMTTIIWILTFVLGWLLIAQLGLGAQGLEMLRRK